MAVNKSTRRGLSASTRALCVRQSNTVLTPAELAKAIKQLPAHQPVTTSLDSSGHCQKEHWLGWLKGYNGPGAYGRTNWNRDAQFVFNHVNNHFMLLWLIEAVGLPRRSILNARDVILKTSNKGAGAACAAIRRIAPWGVIQLKLAAKSGSNPNRTKDYGNR